MNTIDFDIDGKGVGRLRIARPDVHNAFNDQVIKEMSAALEQASERKDLRLLIITGAGKSFSAGADLGWMRSMADASQEDNRADSAQLAKLMRTLNFFPRPTVARVNGSAFGGGVGLIACCDVAIAAKSARFGLTEVRLGLIPAVISPYVIDAIGARSARRLFLTGEHFSAERAVELGLVSEACDSEDLDDRVAECTRHLLRAGPRATGEAKDLIATVSGRTLEEQMRLDEDTAMRIARLRVSAEGQLGLKAFLDKSTPDWSSV